MRQSRKQEHLENYLLSSHKSSNLFDEIFIGHKSITDKKFEDVDTSIEFLGKRISFPFMINAVTGGNDYANEINKDLARIANELNIPMAVGSQKVALEEKETRESFEIVREMNPDGLIISNLGALCTLEEAKEAVEMLNSNAIQLHLNLAQELVMPEGDRDFTEMKESIESVVNGLDIPVILKEVGTGISKDVGNDLYNLGVRYIDCAGKGGSNFVEIEDLRDPGLDASELYDWGIPSALSLLEVLSLKKDDLFVISSGGIRTSTEIAKSLVVGANLCAGSGEIINYLIRGGYNLALDYVKNLRHKFQIIMMLLDVSKVEDLKKVDYKVVGRLRELIG